MDEEALPPTPCTDIDASKKLMLPISKKRVINQYSSSTQ
jgi:hypothetical protein